jgi:hypothetical protein
LPPFGSGMPTASASRLRNSSQSFAATRKNFCHIKPFCCGL